MQKTEEHVEGGEKIRSILLGLNDGLISTFTLLIGIAAATLSSSNSIVILTGLAAMVSGACSMGLGEYISSKSEYNYVKNEIKREKAEIELFPDEEKEEVKEIFEEMGFKGDMLESCVETISSDKEIWANFLIKSELGMEMPDKPTMGAILTFLFFMLGAFIPLFPYIIITGIFSLIWSSILSFSMLFAVGFFKTKITGEKPIKGAIEMILIGIIAFIISFTIGMLLDQLIIT